MTTVIAGSRLHCGLLDLGRATSHAYGGTGFMLEGPQVCVTATKSREWNLESRGELDHRTRRNLEDVLQRVASIASGMSVSVKIEEIPPEHQGFGSKTSLLLSVLTAINEELFLNLSKQEIQYLSGRGGTSGIGIHGFFLGGFVVDEGHPQQKVESLVPSSATYPRNPPKLGLRLPIPQNWRFHLFLAPGIKRSGKSELLFFKENSPIPRDEVLSVVATNQQILIPSVKEANITKLRSALINLHTNGFKARELTSQLSKVNAFFWDLINSCSGAVGMSSMGPLIYVVLDCNDSSEIISTIKIAEKHTVPYLGSYPGNNLGHQIIR